MPDLERFESDLITLAHEYGIDAWVGLPYGEVAAKLIEFLKIVKACHDDSENMSRYQWLQVPPSITASNIERPVPPMSKIEALPATADWCACGWSDEPHLRTEHEPLTPPCPRFKSRPGEFAAGPDSVCDTCAESGRAHGITRLGPLTQIAETLTPLED